MTDEELLRQFEAASIPGDCFHHAEHVRVAFIYLQRFSLLEALEKFSNSLKRFAAANGKPGRYHETITWAFLFLVRERMQGQTWERFSSENGDLLDWRSSILKKYYRDETLASPEARRQFVMPDKNV
ncbi:MAG TPA: hypothetical protein VH088_19235 [Terriglobales bacterium]|jgi:hypothetical protein|nr:hypothetical protein [Terriglobales bacterium]